MSATPLHAAMTMGNATTWKVWKLFWWNNGMERCALLQISSKGLDLQPKLQRHELLLWYGRLSRILHPKVLWLDSARKLRMRRLVQQLRVWTGWRRLFDGLDRVQSLGRSVLGPECSSNKYLDGNCGHRMQLRRVLLWHKKWILLSGEARTIWLQILFNFWVT